MMATLCVQVIPELKQQVSELNRHKHELESQLQDQTAEMSGETKAFNQATCIIILARYGQ